VTVLQPATPWDQTVIYEAHVGHLTARHPLVAEAERGHYRGLHAPAVIDHLQGLGITAVELLPVQHFVSEGTLVAEGRRNVWGYNPLAWGAPHAGYASADGDPVAELREAVAALHAAGVEVLLDVVYNHTCEGPLGTGPILSWRGFDNAAAYRLVGGPDGCTDDDLTGCGNAVDTRSPWVRRLVVETLSRWVTEIGVDGFRFDLAATLIRTDHGPTGSHPLLAEIAAEPMLDGVKVVAEPWDLGPGGYAIGTFGAPWREWNDRFRDDTRDLWRNQPGRWPDLARAVTGSAELFRHRDRKASTSVNAVATHDGFTLADLVTYDEPRGGGHGQRSWGGGCNGESDDPHVRANRAARQRALLATVLLSQGVPMLHAGDELGRTQAGRADGYTLEPDEWGVAWSEADEDLRAWTAAAIAARRATPELRWNRWLEPADPWLTWLDEHGASMDEARWHEPDRQGLQVVISSVDDSTDIAVLIATGSEPVTFTLGPGAWHPLIDSSQARPAGIAPAISGRATLAAPGLLAIRAAPRSAREG
jgi:isoamylase